MRECIGSIRMVWQKAEVGRLFPGLAVPMQLTLIHFHSSSISSKYISWYIASCISLVSAFAGLCYTNEHHQNFSELGRQIWQIFTFFFPAGYQVSWDSDPELSHSGLKRTIHYIDLEAKEMKENRPNEEITWYSSIKCGQIISVHVVQVSQIMRPGPLSVGLGYALPTWNVVMVGWVCTCACVHVCVCMREREGRSRKENLGKEASLTGKGEDELEVILLQNRKTLIWKVAGKSFLLRAA